MEQAEQSETAPALISTKKMFRGAKRVKRDVTTTTSEAKDQDEDTVDVDFPAWMSVNNKSTTSEVVVELEDEPAPAKSPVKVSLFKSRPDNVVRF